VLGADMLQLLLDELDLDVVRETEDHLSGTAMQPHYSRGFGCGELVTFHGPMISAILMTRPICCMLLVEVFLEGRSHWEIRRGSGSSASSRS